MNSKKNLTRLTLVTLITALILPLVNTVAVWSAYKIFESDIAYPYALGEIMKYAYSIIEALCMYAAAFCLSYSIAARARRLSVILTVALSEVLVYAATVLVDFSFYGSPALGASFIWYNVMLCAAELVRHMVVALVALIAAKRVRPVTVCAVSTIVVFVLGILSCVGDTVSILTEAAQAYADWGPQNISEWMTLIMPYISTAIYALAGYLVARFIFFIIDGKPQLNAENQISNEVI